MGVVNTYLNWMEAAEMRRPWRWRMNTTFRQMTSFWNGDAAGFEIKRK